MNALLPGSFDPFTLGHVDIALRAANMFDRVTIAVLVNTAKNSVFTADERVAMIEAAVSELGVSNIDVVSFAGLTAELAYIKSCGVIVRGIRSAADYEYESAIAAVNAHLAEDIDTVFIPSRPEHSFISSSVVREIAAFNGDIKGLVPNVNINSIEERLCKHGK